MTDREEIHLLAHLRPMHLLTALGLYLTGAGLARYLGARIGMGSFLVGMAWLLFSLSGIFFLGDYFRTPFQRPIFPLSDDADHKLISSREKPQVGVLYIAVALLTAAAALTALLAVRHRLSPAVSGLMAVFFLLLGAQVLPGLSLEVSGMGEFATSLSLVLFPPALAFTMLYGGFHRYLSLAVFPLFPLHLALVLTLRLRSYAADLQSGRKTLLVRIGWVRGVYLHNLLILSGFLLFGAALLFGLPLRLAGPVFITLLPAGYLIWYYSGLERGAPVHWILIVTLALIVFYLPLYLLLFSVWIY